MALWLQLCFASFRAVHLIASLAELPGVEGGG